MRFLITSDWHLRSTVPSCVNATETEWMDIQRKALDKIIDIAKTDKVEAVYCGGDVFHSERTASNECVFMAQEFASNLKSLGISFYVLAGNHDLKYHTSTMLSKSAMGVLFNSKNVESMDSQSYIKGCNFDQDDYGDAEMIFKHVLCIPREEIPFGVECETPESLLERYPSARWIFLGDHHKNFHWVSGNRHVLNPGCLTKQASDFEGYVTGVYVVDVEFDTAAFWPVNIEQKFVKNGGAVSVDKSVEDFVNSIRSDSVTLDFVSELRSRSESQKEAVKDKVNSWIDSIGQ